MLTLDYNKKGVFREALTAIDRKEPFALIVQGWKRQRILKAIEPYRAFYDCFVSRGEKSISVLLQFSYHVFWALDFWLLCLYKQGPEKRIDFKNDENVLTIFFDFQNLGSGRGHVLR